MNLKNTILGKNILQLVSHTISLSLLLLLISKNANRWLITGYLKKNKGKQLTLEYFFVNQMNIMNGNLSENRKVLQNKSTPLI